MVFFNGGLLPNSWVSRKIFVSERTSDPYLPDVIVGRNTNEEPVGGMCGILNKKAHYVDANALSHPSVARLKHWVLR